MKLSKRITSIMVSAALLLNTPAITIAASADNTTSKVYAYDGYTVEYFIRAEWQGNQNIEVKITNTGTEPITYWSVGYDASGEISGLWNAQVFGQQGTEYILCGAGYNNEISPGASINFGYTLSGESFKIPQNIINCAKRVDITDGYNVYYNIVGDYGATYQAEMIIENLSGEDISAWSLSFDGNASIDNLWNGKLFENADYHFSVRGDNNTVISANDSVAFNFAGTKSEEWNTDEDNTYEITFENYHLSGIVVSMEYGFEEEIDPELDTDGDGLPDYIEKEIGSDRYKSDTDDDGLPDGYEFYRVGTDPTKADTDDNGISDADEDADDDGLTNIEEYNLGTNPAYFDTDYDGLSDYDELYKYNTDPLVFDTDGDKVSDGDEVTLGLDPNNPATFGYPDNEYTTQQTVSEDDPALQAINSIEDNPFTISVDITAAGVAENCLSAGESGYSYPILQNDAVLGVVPELSYSGELSVTDVVIKFNLNDSAVNNDDEGVPDDLKGINKYIIFKYFEDTNMLLPVETAYDATTNSISTHVDDVGTYCVMNVNKWLSNMDSVPAGNYYDDVDNEPANIVFCLDTRGIIGESTLDQLKKDIREISEDAFDRYADIKLYVYYQQFGSNFKVVNNLLSNLDKNYFDNYEELESALDNLTTYTIKNKYWAYDYVTATQYMVDTCDNNIIAMYHFVSDERVMGSVTGVKKLMTEIKESRYKTSDNKDINRIYVSTICLNKDKKFDTNSYVYKIAELSGGTVDTIGEIEEADNEIIHVEKVELAFNSGSSTTSKVTENVIKILGDGNKRLYNIISATGWTPIRLHKILKSDSAEDYDLDGKRDWDEVDIDLIWKYYKKSTNVIYSTHLPTLGQLNGESDESGEVKGYVAAGYDIFVKDLAAKKYSGDIEKAKQKANTYKVLPIISDPTNPDSDGDYMLDCLDNDLDKAEFWDIVDPNPLYAYANTHDNYGINAANIYVEKTNKKPEEYIVKKQVSLLYTLSQEDYTSENWDDKETGASRKYIPFPYELQEYMQSCCDTVIKAYKNISIDNWRMQMLEKYLRPEIIMAIGTTESAWTYGDSGCGITTNFVGIAKKSQIYIKNMIGAGNASTEFDDYINIYCSVSAAVCIIANDIAFAGDNVCRIGNKKYSKDDEQQLIYDAFYIYAKGNQYNYDHPASRIYSAYKLYAFQEFCKVRKWNWANWKKEYIINYCDNVTTFSWEENKDFKNVSYFELPINSKYKVKGEPLS